MTTVFHDQPASRRHERFAERFNVRESDFFRPLAILGLLTFLTVMIGVHLSMQAIDRSATTREQMLVKNGIAQRIAEVAQMVVPQVDWDDAVSHLDNHYDATWAAANIGKFLNQTDGFDSSFVLGRDGTPLFASRSGVVHPATSYAGIRPLVAPLIASVRAGERHRGPIRPDRSGAMVSRPIQASALKMVGGQLAIVTATLVQPDFGTAMPTAAIAPIVITVMHIDQTFLDQFASRYLLNGLHIRSIAAVPRHGETALAARGGDGAPIAWFAWTPFTPGYTMLRSMVVPLLLIGVMLSGVAYLQLRHIHRAAGYLIWREKQVRALADFDPITSLPNENFLREHIGHRLAAGDTGFGVIVAYPRQRASADVDGEESSQMWARRLQDLCPADGLIARLADGGFAYLVPVNDAEETEQRRARIAAACSGAVSAGAASAGPNAGTVSDILKAARAGLRR